MYFAAMMNAAWNLQGDAAQYKSYGKGWAADDTTQAKRPGTSSAYTRTNKDPDGQPTIRSGMISGDNPFGHMSKYYEKQGSPVRQSLANIKHYKDPETNFKQITG